MVGRSDIVGKPVALLLLHARRDRDDLPLPHARPRGAVTRAADVLVAAVGVPGSCAGAMVKPGAAVIDVGINRTRTGSSATSSRPWPSAPGCLTPVPGGVGPMTIAMLLKSTVRAARYRRRLLAHPAA